MEIKKDKTQMVSLEKLSPSPWNPRLCKDDRFKNLCKSMEKDPDFLWLRPVLATKAGLIFGGNMRYRAAKELGWEAIPTIITDIPETLAKERAIKDNNQFGEWDDSLATIIDELEKEGIDTSQLGLDDATMKILDSLEEAEIVEDEAPPLPSEPKSKLGDLYQLGNHRLLCGDATKAEDVERLMDGEKADMVFTDPPYSVNYTKKAKEVLKSKEYVEIANDNMSVEDTAETLWRPYFELCSQIGKDTASIYCTMPQGGDQMMMMMMMKNVGWQVKHELIWVKDAPVFSMGRLDYDYKHEPIAYGWKKKHEFYGKGEFTKSVWEIPRTENKLHPTMKPVRLIANALGNSTEEDMVVYDGFGGSGSTLIACEQLNRKCYMMEIDPRYIDCIVKRWENLTGKKATLLN